MKFSRIFVQNTGTAFEDGGTSDFNNLPDQTVQLIDTVAGESINTSAEVGSNNDITDFSRVQLAFRDSTIADNGLVELSPVIPVGELEMTNLSHANPQQQQVTVTIPSTGAVDKMLTVKITDLEQGHQPFNRRSYQVEAKSSDTDAEVAQKFADAINEAEDQINGFEGASVSASTSGADLILTANQVGDIFDVATRNFDPSITTNTNPTDGVGTYEQVSKYEQNDRGTLGNYVQSTNLLGSLPEDPEYAHPSGEYDLLTFSFPGDSEKAVNKSIDSQHYIVALEAAVLGNATESSGDAGTDDFVEFFDPVIVS